MSNRHNVFQTYTTKIDSVLRILIADQSADQQPAIGNPSSRPSSR